MAAMCRECQQVMSTLFCFDCRKHLCRGCSGALHRATQSVQHRRRLLTSMTANEEAEYNRLKGQSAAGATRVGRASHLTQSSRPVLAGLAPDIDAQPAADHNVDQFRANLGTLSWQRKPTSSLTSPTSRRESLQPQSVPQQGSPKKKKGKQLARSRAAQPSTGSPRTPSSRATGAKDSAFDPLEAAVMARVNSAKSKRKTSNEAISTPVQRKLSSGSRSRKGQGTANANAAAAMATEQSIEPSSRSRIRLESLSLPSGIKKALLPFQREGVEFIASMSGRALIGDEMGLGKSLQALAGMCLYRDDWPLLIVCPSSVRGAWQDEVERWFPHIHPATIKTIRSGQDIRELASFQVVVVTYALLQQPVLLEAVKAVGFKCMIVDESHYIKNRKSKRATSIVPLVQAASRSILLSGTPALSRPEELYAQLDSLRPNFFGPFTTFAKKFCNAHRDRFGWNTRGASNIPELHALLRQHFMIRRLKRDVLTQLPPKRRQRIMLDISDGAALGAIAAGFRRLKELEDDTEANPLEHHQILTSLYTTTAEAKCKAVADYVSEMCSSGQKFLVFAHHLNVIDAIKAAVAKQKVDHIVIVGETPVHERHDLVRKFQANDTCRVAVLSIKAAGQGLTLTAASTVVFGELHWTPGLLEQAEDRAHRIGQASSVNIHYLVARGTLDDVMWQTLSKKVSVVSSTLNGAADKLLASRHAAKDILAGLERVEPVRSEDPDDVSNVLKACSDFAECYAPDDLRNYFTPRRKKQDVGKASVSVTPVIGSGKSAESWTCSRCTFVNQSRSLMGTRRSCQMCGASRSSTSTTSSQNDDDTSSTSVPSSSKSPSKKAVVVVDDVEEVSDDEDKSQDDECVTGAKSTASGDATSAPSSATSQKQQFSFFLSPNTGRIWLFDREGTSLQANFHIDDFLFDNVDSLPSLVRSPTAKQAISRFLKEYGKLGRQQQRNIRGFVMTNIADGLRQSTQTKLGHTSKALVKPTKGSVQRYTPISKFAVSTPAKGEESTSKNQRSSANTALASSSGVIPAPASRPDGKALRARSSLSGAQSSSDPMPSLVSPKTPNVQGKRQSENDQSAADEEPEFACRFCGQAIRNFPMSATPTPEKHKRRKLSNGNGVHEKQNEDAAAEKRHIFCSHECWQSFSIQTGSGNSIRKALLELEGGICALCGVDAHALFQKVSALTSLQDRMGILGNNPIFRRLAPSRIRSIAEKPRECDFWQADHINPVCEGGGEAQDMNNFRTLCTPCHLKETAKLAEGKARRELAKASKGSKDIRSWFKT